MKKPELIIDKGRYKWIVFVKKDDGGERAIAFFFRCIDAVECVRAIYRLWEER